MGVMDTILDAVATAAQLRKKPAPLSPSQEPTQRRVKTPAEYEEEDRRAAEGRSGNPSLRDKQTHKMVSDDLFNYGQD